MTQPFLPLSRPAWEPADFRREKLALDEIAVLDALRIHEGIEAAIKEPDLAAVVDLSVRSLRAVLKSLRENHGIAVATTTRPPYGAYLIVNAEELEAFCRNLRARALSMLTGEARLRRVHLAKLVGQIGMELGEE